MTRSHPTLLMKSPLAAISKYAVGGNGFQPCTTYVRSARLQWSIFILINFTESLTG